MERLVIDGIIFGLQKAGGISRMWAEILLGLDEQFARTHSVYVLIPRNSNVEWKRIVSCLKHIKIIKRRRFRWGKRSYWRESLYLSWIALKLKPTIWHTSFFVGFPRLYYFFQRISWLYDMIPEKLHVATPYETNMKYRTLDVADKVLSISSYSKKDLEEIWPKLAKKSLVIPICTAEMEVVFEVPKPYFVYLGTRKGYKHFLPAVKEILKDPRFSAYEIYAIGGEETWSFEENQAFTMLEALKRVRLLGILPLEEVRKMCASSSIILFPSLYEGFGLPVLEAFLMGVPVLACNTSSIPEITGNNYPLAEPGSSGSYSDTLAKLLKERNKWVEYGKKRGELFTRAKLIKALIQVYNHAI